MVGQGHELTTIHGPGTAHVVSVVGVHSAKISGFTIMGDGKVYGIEAVDSDGSVIQNNRITGNSHGIELSGATRAIVSQNIIEANSSYGININRAATIIRNNLIYANTLLSG